MLLTDNTLECEKVLLVTYCKVCSSLQTQGEVAVHSSDDSLVYTGNNKTNSK